MVDVGSIQGASHILHLSQPAVSKIVRRLELSLGVTLLDRGPRGVAPTEYGQLLYRTARAMAEEQRNLSWELEALKGLVHGQAAVGMGPILGETLLGPVVRRLRRERPGLGLKVIGGSWQELKGALLRGEIDIIFSGLPDIEEDRDVQLHSIRPSVSALVVRREHPLAARGQASMEELSACDWLLPEHPRNHSADVIAAFLAAGVKPPSVHVHTNNIYFARALLMETDFVTIMPVIMLRSNAVRDRLVAIQSDIAISAANVGYAIRARSSLSPGARAVIAIAAHLIRSDGSATAQTMG